MQVSLPPFFINEHSFLLSLRDVDGSEDDEIRDEIPRDVEEDPDADIDELDFFSDED